MLTFISLYNLLGWPAFVGVAIMVFSIPLNTCTFEYFDRSILALVLTYCLVIARILKRMQQQQMKNRDKRTRLMSELLANIKRLAGTSVCSYDETELFLGAQYQTIRLGVCFRAKNSSSPERSRTGHVEKVGHCYCM